MPALICIQTVWHSDSVPERYLSQCIRFQTMWYARPAKPQISVCIRTVWSEPLLDARISYECWATDWTLFGVSKLKRWLHRLVWVYTCQNATLSEITCHRLFWKVHFEKNSAYKKNMKNYSACRVNHWLFHWQGDLKKREKFATSGCKQIKEPRSPFAECYNNTPSEERRQYYYDCLVDACRYESKHWEYWRGRSSFKGVCNK